MSNERMIQLEGVSRVIIEEAHGDFVLQGWGRGEARAEWEDDIRVRQEAEVLYLEVHGDGRLYLPHHVDMEIGEVHGDLTANGVPTSLKLEVVHGDGRFDNMGAIHLQEIHGDLGIHDSVGPLLLETVAGDLEVRGIANAVDLRDVEGDAKLHSIVGAVTIGNVGGDMKLREVRGNAQVENVGGDLSASHLHGNCQTTVGGDLKVGAVSGNLTCTVGGDAVIRVEPESEQRYRIHAGGDIICRFSANAGVAINATSGGEITVKHLPIQIDRDIQTLQTVLGDGSATIELTAGGDIVLVGRDRDIEWEFDFTGDFAEELGAKFAVNAERMAHQIEQQVTHMVQQLDDKISHFVNNEEIGINIQEKIQSAMQRAEEKIRRGDASSRGEGTRSRSAGRGTGGPSG